MEKRTKRKLTLNYFAKAQGIIKGGNIILKKIPGEKFYEGEKVEVIILSLLERKRRRFNTFKLGVKKNT